MNKFNIGDTVYHITANQEFVVKEIELLKLGDGENDYKISYRIVSQKESRRCDEEQLERVGPPKVVKFDHKQADDLTRKIAYWKQLREFMYIVDPSWKDRDDNEYEAMKKAIGDLKSRADNSDLQYVWAFALSLTKERTFSSTQKTIISTSATDFVNTLSQF